MAGYHALPSGKKWAVRKSGSARAMRLVDSEALAWGMARNLAEKAGSHAWLHDRDGRIVAHECWPVDHKEEFR